MDHLKQHIALQLNVTGSVCNEFIFLQTRDLKIAYSLTAGTYFAIGLIFYSCFPLAKECIEQVCCHYLSYRHIPKFEYGYYFHTIFRCRDTFCPQFVGNERF